ncbi:Hexosyltransferase [Quillaja saponaria]|uniref:Hexosyltransferase n=1 Tax=Quillaja saponaria TaxID=32244 RepID=A0AAD7PMI3_QUISA|nr:Hexosyltransferase [Quillaja saponaria]
MKSGGVAVTGGGGGVPSYAFPAKRRWRGLVIGVLGLVVLSMLVPLVFLLGLHNGFHSAGYISERQNSPSSGFKGYDVYNVPATKNHSETDQSNHVDDLMRRFRPTLSKDAPKSYSQEAENQTVIANTRHDGQLQEGSMVPPPPHGVVQSGPKKNNSRFGHIVEVTQYKKGSIDESGKSCELTFGSYCLWRQEHKEDMKDFMVKKLKDQLFVARAYYPSIAKLSAQDKLSRELKLNIQELERVLSESTTDSDLPPQIEKKLQRMEAAIARAKSFSVDCNNVDKKLRQIFDLTEDEANFHMKQSAFLYKLTVQTTPKGLHCLSLKLTVQYFKSPPHDMEALAEKYVDPSLLHYVIFSNNVLASSVVINSTVMHAKESWNLVFHVLTDGQNYFAMKLWFFRNTYKEATVQVLNIEHLYLDKYDKVTLPHMFLPEEFRVSSYSAGNSPTSQIRTEYMSIFSHSHYILPKIFQNLKKIVVLDDDIVVQQDLSPLWSLAMGEKVNGAVQFCSVRLGQLNRYLGKNSFRKDSCAWMSGLNVIDLVMWRKLDLSATYQRLVKELRTQEGIY